MAKTPKQPDAVAVRYDLHDLPTAQHKAGLAGLLLQIESMNERREAGADLPTPPEVVGQGPAFAEVRFTAASTQAVFDDLYAANPVEKWTPTWNSKKKGKPIRTEVVDVPSGKSGKTRRETRHFYNDAEPAGRFLARYTDDGKELWHKLWRDMLWAIPRGKPTTRGPFKARAEDKATKDGADAWKGLVAHDKAKKKGGKTVEVAGAILLGAQAVSAESMKFEDRADHALLLHFWHLTTRVYVPARIEQDQKTRKWQEKLVGYVLAVPEISDLHEFCRALKRVLSEMSPRPMLYRPAEAVVSLAAEGALAFMRNLDRLVSARELPRQAPAYLSGVEFYHYIDRDAKGKKLRDPKVATHGRVPAWDGLLTRYDGLMSKGGPKNPIMLAGRLRAMLDDVPWFARLGDDLVEREWSWFVHSRKEGHTTPFAMMSFAWDGRRRFQQLEQKIADMNAETSKADRIVSPEAVDRIVYRMVEECVVRRARAKMGVSEDAPRWGPATHRRVTGKDGQPRWQEQPQFQEKRRDAASSLYLKLRSRYGEDFVEQFTKELGAVAHFLPIEDYAVLSAALLRTFTSEHGEDRPRTRDDVKTLVLLALSANSRSLTAKSDDTDQPAGDGEKD